MKKGFLVQSQVERTFVRARSFKRDRAGFGLLAKARGEGASAGLYAVLPLERAETRRWRFTVAT